MSADRHGGGASVPGSPAGPDAATGDNAFGVVLGWTGEQLGDRLILRMQSARTRPQDASDVTTFSYFLTRQQAAQLGHWLFQISDQTPPPPRRGRLARLLGRP